MRCDGGRSKGLKEANAAGERWSDRWVLSCFGGLSHERQSVTAERERERERPVGSITPRLAGPDPALCRCELSLPPAAAGHVGGARRDEAATWVIRKLRRGKKGEKCR
jgi:hypothetical protein